MRHLVLLAVLAFATTAAAAPSPLENVGAQALPDVAFADVEPTSVLHVSPAGDDTAEGTEAAPLRTVAAAIEKLRPGQAVWLHEGEYAEKLDLSASGTAEAPLQLAAAPGETATLRATGEGWSMVTVSGAYWIVDGLRFDGNGSGKTHAIHFDRARHVVARNLDVVGGYGTSALHVQGEDLAILDSTLKGWKNDGQDAHAVAILPDAARILIRGNESTGNDGDSVQCVGPDVEPGTNVTRDVTIEGNHFHHERENAVDIKTCEQVTIRGNEMSGFRAASTAPQGAALIVHMSARSILIEKNRISDSGRALSAGGVMMTDRKVSTVAVRGNVVFDNTTDSNSSGDAIRFGTVQHVEISNNTVVGMPNSSIKVGDGDDGPTEDVRIFNNVLVNGGSSLNIETGGVTGLQSDHNLFFEAPIVADGSAVELAAWQSKSGQDASSVVTDPMFIDDPRANGFFTKDGSPARDVGLPTADESCDGAPDLGAAEACEDPDEVTAPGMPELPFEPTPVPGLDGETSGIGEGGELQGPGCSAGGGGFAGFAFMGVLAALRRRARS